MKLPLLNRLRRRDYRDLAVLQDGIVGALYSIDSSIVLHGGTVVWRCFGGSRFSNDIDAYLQKRAKPIDMAKIKERVSRIAAEAGTTLEKVKDTGNIMFMGFSRAGTYLKVEINHAAPSMMPVATKFENADGTYIDILTLSPEDLILEKIGAYSDRKFIRDIYDIYVLSDYSKDKPKIRKQVISFLKGMSEPVNAENLDVLIYEGPVPTFKSMVEHIKSVFE